MSVSSSFEPLVLKAIASIGSGSVRAIDGSHNAAQVAAELLDEVTRPALRDLKIEIEGIRTARVYPTDLPNLAAGSQHVILGRYLPGDLPDDADQTGRIIVTGTQGDTPIRYAVPVSLKDAEKGNSFIPRLWARMHLDSLLSEGSSQSIKDDIIALSEEYHIMTPYNVIIGIGER